MEAMYYQKEGAGSVRCLLCPHHCLIPPGRTGKCHTRRNADGTLTLLTYGQCASAALDPIEKKPLRHFHPGTQILSLGSPGCNLACPWCQNWQISQAIPVCETITPESVYRTAVSLRETGNIGVAWTYNEPCTWYEFIRHTAPLIQSAGMVNVMVTNGYIEKEPLAELLPFIDAWNIDLKAWNDATYRHYCQGTLEPVKETIRAAAARQHVEVTCLIIPGLNDDPGDMDNLAAWLASLRPDIPLHITRYFPRYHMTEAPTPVATLQTLQAIAAAYLKHVYIGNV